MANVSDMGWGSYLNREGVFYRGKNKLVFPQNPSESDKILAVFSSTEGNLDAINMYDSGIISSGIVQWIESNQYSVSDMLGDVAKKNRTLLKPVDDKAAKSNLVFKLNAKGRYRFFFLDSRGEVDRLQEQQQMFLLNSDGHKGTWDDESKLYAKEWAAAVATVWEHPDAQAIQVNYTASRANGFMLPYAKNFFNTAPDTNIAKCLKAGYLSFAANNPTWANNHLKIGIETNTYSAWSIEWVDTIFKQLTFGQNIVIYPIRYNAIRPKLESLYGVNLADTADELKKFVQKIGGGEELLTVKEYQGILLKLGFDLGPKKDDGVDGPKTRTAVAMFQSMNSLESTGYVDIETRKAFLTAKNIFTQNNA